MAVTFLFVCYEPIKDFAAITKDTIRLKLDPDFPEPAEQKRIPLRAAAASAVSDEPKNSGDHWPVTGWPIEKLSTGAEADYLSDIEKDVMLHLNMARTNPKKYANDFIAPRAQYYKGQLYKEPWAPSDFAGHIKQEGVEAVFECAGAMERTAPIALLKPSEGIAQAASAHAIDQSRTGDTGHTGSDRSIPSVRLSRYGKWQILMGENVSYGPATGREIVVGLLIDDGVLGRSHRENILNPQFKFAGVSVKRHPVYRYVCVIDFALSYMEY